MNAATMRPRGRPAPSPHGRPGRWDQYRRAGRWLALAAAALVLGTAAAGGWFYSALSGNIHGAGVDDALGDNRPQATQGGENVLIIGSDSRAGLGGAFGENLTTMQSDTLMLLHIGGSGEWATVVSFPRDSWVRIPSCRQGNGAVSTPHHFKINEAFAIGGSTGDTAKAAACAIKTVEQNTRVRVDHFMIVDFRGFTGMVDALGGVEVCPPLPIHDKKAHLDLRAGCQTLKNEQALGYVRARYSLGDGTDIGRIGRQQEFMRALAAKARAQLYQPRALYGFLDAATESLTTDPELAGLEPLYKLASGIKRMPEERITFLTVPNYPRARDVPGDTANVVWHPPAAQQLFNALLNDREMTRSRLVKAAEQLPPAAGTVRVTVLNGTDVPGKARETAERLRALGFRITATGNAPAAAGRSTLTYPEGLADQARSLATRLPGLDPAPSEGTGPGTVTLTIGPDLPDVTG
ncbi:LCP family protein [Streptomyces sp. 35G-GA-8]|uniref:LCP family protein n=1 Tax=Streptomyces sp. 35G-GA-8 TaxID=2939434 RepID=UPI00201F8B26|nr:LCP family protein [Streptomyces sp. 35G-GA-8]MCL7378189.1 LCP family protein [Streptomyces sp. 35G-GA-8]